MTLTPEREAVLRRYASREYAPDLGCRDLLAEVDRLRGLHRERCETLDRAARRADRLEQAIWEALAYIETPISQTWKWDFLRGILRAALDEENNT